MYITLLAQLIISLIIFIAFPTSAKDITVYRWVDKNNVVHFSQNQPVSDNYIELKMADTANISAKESDKKLTTKEVEKTEIEFPLLTNEKCKSAKKNVSTLLEFDKIQSTDADGKIKMLSTKEKAQQLAMFRKQAEVYCAI